MFPVTKGPITKWLLYWIKPSCFVPLYSLALLSCFLSASISLRILFAMLKSKALCMSGSEHRPFKKQKTLKLFEDWFANGGTIPNPEHFVWILKGYGTSVTFGTKCNTIFFALSIFLNSHNYSMQNSFANLRMFAEGSLSGCQMPFSTIRNSAILFHL